MSSTAVDTSENWFEPDELAYLRRRVPFSYIDVVPVRTDDTGTVTEIGLLLRATGDGRITRCLVSGRVLFHERIRDAIARHVEKDLGPMALPLIPVSPAPFTIAEYFPTPGAAPFHDERQHAISLAYVVPVTGTCEPQQDALDLSWYTPDELRDNAILAELTDGRDELVRRALAHCGV